MLKGVTTEQELNQTPLADLLRQDMKEIGRKQTDLYKDLDASYQEQIFIGQMLGSIKFAYLVHAEILQGTIIFNLPKQQDVMIYTSKENFRAAIRVLITMHLRQSRLFMTDLPKRR